MNPRRTVIIALLLAAALGGLLAGCEGNPPEPAFDNPFDPGGPQGGDPLNIRAFLSGTAITVIWDHLDGYDIDAYDLDRSIGDQSSWESLAVDLPADRPSYIDSSAIPNTIHYYKVQAKTADGSFTVASYITAAEIETPPFVIPSPQGQDRPSRYLDLKIVVSLGDSVRVAGDTTFADADTHAAEAAGDTLLVAWDLGPQDANGDTMNVYVQSFGGGFVSERADLQFLVDFEPPFTAQDMSEAGTVATRDIVLEIPTDGVEFMRFAADTFGLIGATPVPAAETYPYQLTDVLQPQSVWGQFDGDFGFSSRVMITVLPDQLGDASFELDLPDNRVISIPEVTVVSDAVATWMIYSESPDMTGSIWVPYETTQVVPISSTPGTRMFYVQYENDWETSAILADTFEFVLTDLSIAFHTPEPDTTIAGGGPYNVSGRAVVADFGTLTDLKLDLGDGAGFSVSPTRQEYWNYLWDVPEFSADSTLVLRARAWAGTDSVTTSVTVTVTQLAVAISEPVAGEMLDQDSEVTIAGTAVPPLDGAVDSVTVDIGAEHFLAIGTTDWTLDWTTPAVTASTPYTIRATAWADGETVETAVDVTVEPEAP